MATDHEITLSDLDDLISSVPLPAMPETAVRLLELSQNPEVEPMDFAKVIETDAALSTQVLSFVNSAYFGFQIGNDIFARPYHHVIRICKYDLRARLFDRFRQQPFNAAAGSNRHKHRRRNRSVCRFQQPASRIRSGVLRCYFKNAHRYLNLTFAVSICVFHTIWISIENGYRAKVRISYL